jgi:hypothetical protein
MARALPLRPDQGSIAEAAPAFRHPALWWSLQTPLLVSERLAT